MPNDSEDRASKLALVLSGGARPCILAVDDDVLIAMSTIELLQDMGCDVIEANSGEQAIQILRGDTPVDLLLTDYSMPGMNGVELAEAALEVRPELPILVATGYSELPSGGALKLPCLGKPYRESELADAIGRLLNR